MEQINDKKPVSWKSPRNIPKAVVRGPIVDSYGNVVGSVSRLDKEGKRVAVPVSELRKLLIENIWTCN